MSFAESVDRFSQLKAPALKYPWAGIYFVGFISLSVIAAGWLVAVGIRQAMAPEPGTAAGNEDERRDDASTPD